MHTTGRITRAQFPPVRGEMHGDSTDEAQRAGAVPAAALLCRSLLWKPPPGGAQSQWLPLPSAALLPSPLHMRTMRASVFYSSHPPPPQRTVHRSTQSGHLTKPGQRSASWRGRIQNNPEQGLCGTHTPPSCCWWRPLPNIGLGGNSQSAKSRERQRVFQAPTAPLAPDPVPGAWRHPFIRHLALWQLPLWLQDAQEGFCHPPPWQLLQAQVEKTRRKDTDAEEELGRRTKPKSKTRKLPVTGREAGLNG